MHHSTTVVETAPQSPAQAREQLLTVASHDLRGALANIRGYAGLLLSPKYGLDERALRSVEVIARNADRVLKLLRLFFEGEKARIGTFLAEGDPVDPIVLVRECVETARAAAHAAGVELLLWAEPGGELTLEIDLFRHAVGALIEHSIARSPRGGEVIVETRWNEDTFWIGASDEGASVDRALAFDSDFQGAVEHRLGAGFELGIARYEIEAHGGRAGDERDGTRHTFFFTLPR